MRTRGNYTLRPVKITRQYTCYAEGSVLIELGRTKVLCNASVINGVPRFLKNTAQGWVTAEYGMLPRATNLRTDREASRGKQGGRTQEIQRLIGRSLRGIVDLSRLGEYTITCDCDVLQADGGTRTAAITGGCVALIDAINSLGNPSPVRGLIAAISVGIKEGEILLDLDYEEDSSCDADLNVVMLEDLRLVELQGTAERKAFDRPTLQRVLDVAEEGIKQLLEIQRAVLQIE